MDGQQALGIAPNLIVALALQSQRDQIDQCILTLRVALENAAVHFLRFVEFPSKL